MARILDKDNLKDVVRGAAFLGTGGGGSIEMGLKTVNELLDKIEIISLDEVEDDSQIVVVEGMGSPEAMLKKGISDETINAFEAFQEYTEENIDYMIPVETGAGNSITPMIVSAAKSIPIVDADGAGRAIPELQQTTFSIYGIPMCPAVLADDHDNWVVVNVNDDHMMEDLSRAITTEFGQHAGLVWHKMTGDEMKEVVIPETISISEKVGKAIKESKKEKKNPVRTVLEIVDGYELITGKVEDKTTETRKGFDYGEVTVKKDEETFKVSFKNENILAYKNDELLAMVPDRICWITTDGKPLTNTDIEEGMDVSCIGIKAHDKWTTKRAIATFDRVLDEFGHTGGYQPISDLMEG
ncbi:MAG: DUF917 domain-containing protein [Candidatus Natronoplasma sp.]